MNRKRRHQQGTLARHKTAEGTCWYIRFTDNRPGMPKRPRFLVGLLSQFPTQASASRAAQSIRDTFNDSPDPLFADRRTFGDLIDRYVDEEIPQQYSTKRGYLKLIRCHIRPKWGTVALSAVKAQDVRKWLLELEMSSRYRGHIHGLMRVLFRFAMLWEWVALATNPMSLFSLEGATKRQAEPNVLTEAQFHTLLTKVEREDHRLMLLGAMSLGLRCSELFALQWRDFDLPQRVVHIQRAIVEGYVGKVKTIHSKKPLPLDALLASAFRSWREKTLFSADDDWVFANANSGGEKPFYPSNIQHEVLVPAARAAKLGFPLGWHTFRHSYKTWLDIKGVPLTVQRDLMRHADIRTTAQVYGQVRIEELREANSDVVQRVILQ